jgi:hypothetical protein
MLSGTPMLNGIGQALVISVILDDDRRANFGPTPINVRVIEKNNITALHG